MNVQLRNMSAVEDYLKVIFNLGEWDPDELTNGNIAARLGVSTASASEMIRKLVARGLVSHERYGGVELTESGHALALAMVRRHRILETYLVACLGYSWDEVHDEAEVLEHAVSDVLLDRLDRALDHPWRDPHGDPVPTVDGVLHAPRSRPLLALDPGEHGFVSRLVDDEPVLLRWFSEHGIGLDTEVTVRQQKPFGGPLVVEVGAAADAQSVELGLQASAALWVAEHRPTPGLAPGECPYPDCRHRPVG